MDGQFYFGAAQDGADLAEVIRTLTTRIKAEGKIAMMGVSPQYRGLGSNFRVFDARGFSGMAAQWQAAIEAGADWVELVTWNDWGEATYVEPFGGRALYPLWNGHWGELTAHDAFLEASRYYIDWFKRGTPPMVAHDAIYYFYRPHLKSAEGLATIQPEERGRPDGVERLLDAVFLTARLREPAELVVTVGNSSNIRPLKAGLSQLAVPLALGAVSLKLQRNGQTLAEKQLELKVTTARPATSICFRGRSKRVHTVADGDQAAHEKCLAAPHTMTTTEQTA